MEASLPHEHEHGRTCEKTVASPSDQHEVRRFDRVDIDILKGSLAMLVGHLLAERAMYGYEIMNEARRRSEDRLVLKEGTLYPALHRLEFSGLLRSERRTGHDGRTRRYYTLTEAGRRFVAERERIWRSFRLAVDAVLA
jgi:PadR family transcriptional regulator